MKRKRKWNPKKFFACGKPWYKKWWVIFLLFFMVVVFIPWTINHVYMIGRDLEKQNTIFLASDLLTLYVGLLTFVGSLFLGVAVFEQTEYYNKKQDKMENANIQTPFFIIDEVHLPKSNKSIPFGVSHYRINGNEAVVELKNVGVGLATNVYYKNWFGECSNPEDHYMNLCVNQLGVFPVKLRVDSRNTDEIQEKVIFYQNMVGFCYKQVLRYKLVCEYEQVDEDENKENYFLHVYPIGRQQRIGMSAPPEENPDK